MIAHVFEKGPASVYNPHTGGFDCFHDVCGRCQCVKSRHRSRGWIYWSRLAMSTRLTQLRIGMDRTAHDHYMATIGLIGYEEQAS